MYTANTQGTIHPRMDELSWRDLIDFVQRSWRWTLTGAGVAIAIAVYHHHASPQFEARSVILIQESENNAMQAITQRLSGSGGLDYREEPVERYLPFLSSPVLYRKVAEKLVLRPDFDAIKPTLGFQEKVTWQDRIKRWFGARAPASTVSPVEIEAITEAIMASTVAQRDSFDTMRIGTRSPSRKSAVILTQLVSETAVEEFVERGLKELDEARTFLMQQIADIQAKVQRTNDIILMLLSKNRMPAEGKKQDEIAQNITLLKRDLAETETAYQENEEIIQKLKSKMVAMSPDAARIEEQQETDPNFQYSVSGQIRRLHLQNEIYEAKIKSLRGVIESILSANLNVPKTEQELLDLRRQTELEYSFIAELNRQLLSLEVERISVKNKVRLVETPSEARTGRSTSLRSQAGVAGLIGAFLAGFLFFLYETAFPMVQRKHDFKHLPVFLAGSIPDLNRKKAFRYRFKKFFKVEPEPQTPLMKNPLTLDFEVDCSETMSFKYLRNGLLHCKPSASARVIAIASASVGEGKSFIAANLSTALSAMGYRVVLVDCDLRKHSVTSAFGFTGFDGLTTVLDTDLTRGKTHRDMIKKVGPGGKLHLLPAGIYRADATEMLSSPMFMGMVDILRKHYDFVVLDTPPFLSTADATAVTICADLVCLTAIPGKSYAEDLERAIERLKQIKTPPFALVLNRDTLRPVKDPRSGFLSKLRAA